MTASSRMDPPGSAIYFTPLAAAGDRVQGLFVPRLRFFVFIHFGTPQKQFLIVYSI